MALDLAKRALDHGQGGVPHLPRVPVLDGHVVPSWKVSVKAQPGCTHGHKPLGLRRDDLWKCAGFLVVEVVGVQCTADTRVPCISHEHAGILSHHSSCGTLVVASHLSAADDENFRGVAVFHPVEIAADEILR